MSFQKYASVYDAIYGDKDYDAEARFICDLFRTYALRPVHSVAEFGAGSGKLAGELQERGFEVVGIDLSSDMVEQASKHPGRPRIMQGDIRNFNFGEVFDAAVSFFHVISYMQTLEDVTAAFKNVSRHLASGGLFIFDFWFEGAVRRKPPEIRVKRVRAGDMEIVRIAEPFLQNSKFLQYLIKYSVFFCEASKERCWESFEEDHVMTSFEIEFLDRIGQQVGFERVHASATLSFEQPTNESWGVTCVYRKTE